MTQYLVRDLGFVAHLWDGKDTYCKMYSRGKLAKSKYQVTDDKRDDRICHTCKLKRLSRNQKAQP